MTSESAAAALPTWDLRDLYPGQDSPQFDADLARSAAEAAAFEARHKGRLTALDGAAFGQAIAAYERMQETLARVLSYAQLVHAGDMENPEVGRFYQTAQERVNDVSRKLLFFALEINRLDDAALEAKLTAPEAARYRPWLRDLRAFRAHQLSDDAERLLHDKEVAGRLAWVRLFDETIAALRFPVAGRRLAASEAFDLLSDRDAALRHQAAKAIGRVLKEREREFALITNTLAKDKEIEDRWRGFARPVSSRNLANQVEDAVVEALVAAVKGAYGELAHRYYRIKAHWFGQDRLDYWDRNAPLPEDEGRAIPWDEAKATVLDA